MRKAVVACMVVLMCSLAASPAVAGVDPGVADTVRLSSVAWNGDTAFSMDLSTATDDSLEQATVILTWSTSEIQIDSVSLVGSRWATQVAGGNGAFVATQGEVGGTPSAVHYNISFLPFGQLLPPGDGLACRIHWSKTTTVTQSSITVDSSTTSSGGAVVNSMLFGTSALGADNYVPQFIAGDITADLCDCPWQSDFDQNSVQDALDLNALIDILFFGTPDVQDPQCPKFRADFNCDGVPDALDLNDMVDRLFFGGSPPCDPCAP